jgi:hypothetical protein
MSEVAAAASAAPASSGAEASADAAPEAAASESTEQKAAVAAAKKQYKLLIDGKESVEEFDPSDDEAVRKELQLSRAAKKRMSEAVAEKKKAFEIINAFEKDPESMLKRLGPKGREIAEKYLLAQINDDMMSAEEKELRALKQENETYKQKEAREKAEREQAAQAAKENEYAQNFQKTIIDALNKSGLPKTPELVKRMAAVMSKNLEFGLELTPDDLVAEVKGDISALLKSIVGDADGDHLIGLFGDDVANKIRKSDLKKLQEKQGQVFGNQKPAAKQQVERAEQHRPMTMDEWKASIERRIK